MHQGQYPDRLVDLKLAGLLPETGAICPKVLAEHQGADATHGLASSRRENGDPPGTYEYELAAAVMSGTKVQSHSRQDLKKELLRRAHWEQVPLLRCSSHRSAQGDRADESKTRRNITSTGMIYWSGEYWETNWLNDVPYCCRDSNVLFGLKGPPFNSGRPPELAGALDLRPWSCAFGDHTWWWTYPTFGEGERPLPAPQLRPFFQEQHGRILTIQDEPWWIDGLVQLQGRISRERSDAYRAPTRQTSVWEKTGVKVDAFVRTAMWLQGTVWEAPSGAIAGWLVWNYADGTSERVPITYGLTTARFWGDNAQLRAEVNYPQPIWQHREMVGEDNRERWLRLYKQTWVNPQPMLKVSTLDFVSNRECPAAPFLVSIKVSD